MDPEEPDLVGRTEGPQEKHREVLGSPAHFVEAGAGPSLLFVHDWLETLAGFRPLFDHLGPRYRRILVDLPGFGGTPFPEGFDPTLESYAQFLQAVLRESGVRDGTLILHGFGVLVGLTALGEAAGEASRRVSRIVLLNGPLYEPPKRTLGIFGRKGAFEPLESAPPYDLLAFRRRVLARYGNPTYFDEGFVEDLFQSWRPLGPDTLRRLADQRTGYLAGLRPARRALKRWTGPVHVLWGDEDPLQGPGPAQRLKREMRRAHVLLLPDVGYLPHAEAPEAVAAELRKVIRTSRPPSPVPTPSSRAGGRPAPGASGARA